VFDERQGSFAFTVARVSAIADRRTGIGCDQFITLEPPPPDSDADVFMRIHNPDGSEAGTCGNATRCVAILLAQETGRQRFVIGTISGDLHAQVLVDGLVAVDMGPARFDWQDVPLARPGNTLFLDLARCPVATPAVCSMGNPHATFFVDDLSSVPIETLGPALETDPLFPDRANIGFAQILAHDSMRLRVWERGAGLTLACGSGACAALVNAARRGLTGRIATVLVDGGALTIEWTEDGHVLMTGPAEAAFTGSIDLATLPE
jgi:diaminopimelate epimerase